MKRIFFLVILIMIAYCDSVFSQSERNIKTFYVANWNIENIFDMIDDEGKRDEEWLEGGEKNWNEQKLAQKQKNLARVIRYMNDLNGPDILGLQEVEHEKLIADIIEKHLCFRNYKIVYSESPDFRGIDNGIIYDADMFTLLTYEAITVELADNRTTRDILHASFIFDMSDTVHVFVNHWPSRSGSEERSRPNRAAAARTLKQHVDVVLKNSSDANVIIVGDFNDEPSNESISQLLGAGDAGCNLKAGTIEQTLFNLATDQFKDGLGTYLFRGDWNMLDQIIVSGDLVDDADLTYICDSFEIIKPEILVTKSGTYKGSAIPTYGGRTYLGGFSDHFPVGARFIKLSEE